MWTICIQAKRIRLYKRRKKSINVSVICKWRPQPLHLWNFRTPRVIWSPWLEWPRTLIESWRLAGGRQIPSTNYNGSIRSLSIVTLLLQSSHIELFTFSAPYYSSCRDSHDPMFVAVSKSLTIDATLNCYPSFTLIFFITIRLFHMAESVYHFILRFRKFAGFHRPLKFGWTEGMFPRLSWPLLTRSYGCGNWSLSIVILHVVLSREGDNHNSGSNDAQYSYRWRLLTTLSKQFSGKYIPWYRSITLEITIMWW